MLFHLLHGTVVNQRALHRTRLEAGRRRQRRDRLGQFRRKRVVDAVLYEDPVGAHAGLPGVLVFGGDRPLHRAQHMRANRFAISRAIQFGVAAEPKHVPACDVGLRSASEVASGRHDCDAAKRIQIEEILVAGHDHVCAPVYRRLQELVVLWITRRTN